MYKIRLAQPVALPAAELEDRIIVDLESGTASGHIAFTDADGRRIKSRPFSVPLPAEAIDKLARLVLNRAQAEGAVPPGALEVIEER